MSALRNLPFLFILYNTNIPLTKACPRSNVASNQREKHVTSNLRLCSMIKKRRDPLSSATQRTQVRTETSILVCPQDPRAYDRQRNGCSQHLEDATCHGRSLAIQEKGAVALSAPQLSQLNLPHTIVHIACKLLKQKPRRENKRLNNLRTQSES